MSIEATGILGAGKEVHGRRLESWKEIAAYLGRDVTTVRRWEKREGLPVHRLHHSKLGSLHASPRTSTRGAINERQPAQPMPHLFPGCPGRPP